MMKLVLFLVLTIPLVLVSRRSLFKVKKHGLYRFITWECALWLAIENLLLATTEPKGLWYLVASGLTLGSLIIVVVALVTMQRHGQVSRQRHDETLFAFEKTTELVSTGLFRYIRHPMYTSLLCLIWGLYLRQPQSLLLVVAVFGSLSCIAAALIEERENLEFFGDSYREYMHSTRRFIPFVF